MNGSHAPSRFVAVSLAGRAAVRPGPRMPTGRRLCTGPRTRTISRAVQRLIRQGANVNAKNDYGATPMSEAAVTGNAALLEALLKAGADAESPNADGQTALMVVARTGSVEAARVLITHGAKVNAVERWRGQTALMWAVAQGQPAMVRELIARGAQVNARSTVNDWSRQVTAEPRAIYRPAGGLTPLLFAAREGCVACAAALIEGGADLEPVRSRKASARC